MRCHKPAALAIDQSPDSLADLRVIQQRHPVEEGGGAMVKRLKRRELPKLRLVDKDEAEAVLARITGAVSEEDYAFFRAAADAHQSIREALTSSMSDAEAIEHISIALRLTGLR